jgi:hypothetical protein
VYIYIYIYLLSFLFITVCSRLALENIDDAVLCSCINIFEKVMQHDCFTSNQKEKVQQWRSRLGNPRPTPK